MLLNMHIKNIALIDEIDISFEDKLNILTGETGAGKSIIIGSLGICLGGKFAKDLLRDEEKDGLVELMFSVDTEEIEKALTNLEVEIGEEKELLISRRLSPNGRCINRVNDNTVTVSRLKEIASVLIDLHAQHEQQTLLKPAKHLEILDRFGGESVHSLKNKVAESYKIYASLMEEIENSSMDEAEKNKRMDFLQYEIQEIQAAYLKVGEDEELEAQYKKAVNSKEILSTANDIYSLTGYGNSSASEQVGHALGQMRRLTELDGELQNMYDILQDVDSLLSDFNGEFNRYMKDTEFDGETFQDLETRLDLVNSLKAKYGRTIEDIQNSLSDFEEEYEKLVSYEAYMDELKKKCKVAEDNLKKDSEALSKERKKISKVLCQVIKNSLSELNFNAVEFDMKFQELPRYTANGMDEAIFYISTNVGEAIRPLHEVASGGELSRVMLAMKSSLANQDDTPTLVFDEIDVGISGRTAQKVAEQMSVIGSHHQVICITHLPQIAAMADSHYVIEKNVENNKTNTNIRLLTDEEQIEELARLLGGAEITTATFESAREMKALAKQAKIN